MSTLTAPTRREAFVGRDVPALSRRHLARSNLSRASEIVPMTDVDARRRPGG